MVQNRYVDPRKGNPQLNQFFLSSLWSLLELSRGYDRSLGSAGRPFNLFLCTDLG